MTRNTLISVSASLLLAACCCSKPAQAPQAAATPPAAPATEAAAPAVPPNPGRGRGIIIPSAPPAIRSKTILHELVNGRPENVISDFTPAMKEALPAEKLAAVWKDILAKMGEYQSMGEATQTEEQGYKVVYVPLTFANGTLRAKLVYDNTNYVAGMFFQP